MGRPHALPRKPFGSSPPKRGLCQAGRINRSSMVRTPISAVHYGGPVDMHPFSVLPQKQRAGSSSPDTPYSVLHKCIRPTRMAEISMIQTESVLCQRIGVFCEFCVLCGLTMDLNSGYCVPFALPVPALIPAFYMDSACPFNNPRLNPKPA